MLLGLTVAASALAGTPLWMRDVRISPDGTQIAFCYKGDLYKVNAQGGEAVRLTSQVSYESSPVWSPDGRQIAFASDREGNMDVYVMSADGGSARRLTYNSASEVPTAFSPDGQKVYFNAALQDPASSALFPTSAMTELYAVPVAGGRTEQILATPAEMICFLNDGQGSFLYQDRKGFEDEWRKHHTSSVTRDIWRYDATTGRHTNLTNRAGEDRNPILSDNGTEFYFLSERDGGSFNVWRMGLNNPQAVLPVTTFKTHPVRFLSQGKGTLCYTYDGEIYTQTVGGKPQKVKISLTEDDADGGEVGVSSLAVFSEDFYSAMIYDEPQTEYSQDLGLRLYLDYPLEWETRVVGGDPLRYDATGAVIDVEDAVSFLDEGGRSVRDFEERFGRPCCVSWMGEGHVCYELPSEGGEPRYLSLDASGRDDQVYSASVVGEHDVVERVWSADGEA